MLIHCIDLTNLSQPKIECLFPQKQVIFVFCDMYKHKKLALLSIMLEKHQV